MSKLMEVYWEVMMDEPMDLPRFMEQVAEGRHGSFPPEEIADFLREVERDILGNIQTKAGSSPGLDAFVDDRIEETRQMIADLMQRYARK